MTATLTCKELIDFLDDYVADDLAADQRGEFDRHLAVCPECVDYLKTYESAIELARASLCDDRDDPPPGVPSKLIDAVLAARRTIRP